MVKSPLVFNELLGVMADNGSRTPSNFSALLAVSSTTPAFLLIEGLATALEDVPAMLLDDLHLVNQLVRRFGTGGNALALALDLVPIACPMLER
jgi:hypothetical protein